MTIISVEVDASRAINQALLAMIVNGKALSKAPRKTERQGEHYEFLVGVGADETARITMTKEAYKELMK